MQTPEAETMEWFGTVALIVNVACALMLVPHRTGDANVRAVWLFSRNDAIGNIAVLVAAGLVAWTKTAWPDLAVAVIISGLFLHSAWAILRDARADLQHVQWTDATRHNVFSMNAKDHWESIYKSKSDQELSWIQSEPGISLALITEVCPAGRVIDIGGGASVLSARLQDRGYSVAVLDISQTAIDHARSRLGERATEIQWIVADVTANPDLGAFDLWHDRAVFHFLTTVSQRTAYTDVLARTVPVGRHAIIATFALDGPEKCSGLEVRRYDGQSLAAELGPRFALLKSVPEMHITPSGGRQSFQYSVFRRV